MGKTQYRPVLRLLVVSLAVVFLILLASLNAIAAATVTLSATIGPPTTSVSVSGSGFPDNTAVDIYFDASDLALAVSGSTGSFSGITLLVPTSAIPGAHWITAVAEGTTGTAAQASFTVQTNWAQYRYSPLHHGRNPYENVLTSSTVPTLDLDWMFAATGAITSSPAVSGGTVYFGSADDYLYAVNATTGALVWKFKTGNSIIDSSPAVVSGTVYVGSTDDYLYAVNATTGAQVWKFKTGAAINSSPAVINGTVYIGSTDDSVYAVNASTGAQVWKFATSNQVLSSPAVAQGVVFVGSYDDNLYAINATTGAQIWKYTTGGKIFSSPAIIDDNVYVGSDDGNLYAINARTGLLFWKYAGTTGTQFESSPSAYDNLIIVGTDAGYVYSVNAVKGTNNWTLQGTAAEASSTAIANGIDYATVGNTVYAVYQLVTASTIWWGYLGGNSISTPVVANGVLYITCEDDNLYAFDLNPNGQARVAPPKPNPADLRPDPMLIPDLKTAR
ncbi:MAG TPA: PQQ-binding-like beta-propeller repeat protein [Candidatus Binatia bacterium]|nr:PQQ-binding-like beta-propeller repeat protein [Candidatus Binatia bacterium]